MNPYTVLERKRAGEELDRESIRAVIAGATDGSWDDARLAAFLMASAIRGLSAAEMRELTVAMLESGVRWKLAESVPGVVDKHSTGGVGDKVSLILSPLLAACGVPVAMLTGRGLGHTGGTADKLESIPGVSLSLDRERCVELLETCGVAIGVATDRIAPADRRLYELRDRTGTVSSLPLVVGSILSKKLATGAASLALDVKTGSGAFFPERDRSIELARALVETCEDLEVPAGALITDMSQPLGEWVGHASEVNETLDCLEGRGEQRLMEVTLELALLAARLAGHALDRQSLAAAIRDGSARERFMTWARAQGADPAWIDQPRLELAPAEHVIEANRDGVLASVDTKELGLIVGEAARLQDGGIDHAVALRYRGRLGDRVERGQELARLYVRDSSSIDVEALSRSFDVGDRGSEPPLVHERLVP